MGCARLQPDDVSTANLRLPTGILILIQALVLVQGVPRGFILSLQASNGQFGSRACILRTSAVPLPVGAAVAAAGSSAAAAAAACFGAQIANRRLRPFAAAAPNSTTSDTPSTALLYQCLLGLSHHRLALLKAGGVSSRL